MLSEKFTRILFVSSEFGRISEHRGGQCVYTRSKAGIDIRGTSTRKFSAVAVSLSCVLESNHLSLVTAPSLTHVPYLLRVLPFILIGVCAWET